MRHKTPKQFNFYKDRMCHNCENYNKDGVCLEFESDPPEEFANKNNICPLWALEDDDIPF